MSALRTCSSIAVQSCRLVAALVLLGLSAGAQAQAAGTVVLGRATDDGPTLATYSMPVSCSESIAASNCQVHIATDAAFTKIVSQDAPRTEWGLRKDTTYYVRVQSWIFMNGSMKMGPASPVVTYKFVAPPKLPAQLNTTEVLPQIVGSHDCRGMKGTTLLPAGVMRPGQLLRSPNKRYELWYQTDGNLVVYEMTPQRKAIWAHGKMHNNPSFVRLLTDGNVTAMHMESGPEAKPIETLVWETKTAGHPNAVLAMQDDGNLVVYDAKDTCKAWWASKSAK